MKLKWILFDRRPVKRMGTFLDKPKTEKHNEHGAGNGLRYGVSSMQGWRVEMEDAHRVRTGLGEKLDDWYVVYTTIMCLNRYFKC